MREHLDEDRVEVGRQIAHERAWARKIAFRDLEHDVCRAAPFDEWTTGAKLEQHRTDRIQIGSHVDFVAEDLLGRHVASGPFHLPCAGALGGAADDVGDAEVGQLDRAVEGDEHVRWRDVSVDDAANGGRIGMRVREGFCEPKSDGERHRKRHPKLQRASLLDERPQVSTENQLVDDVVGAVASSVVEHAHDRGMLEPLGELGLRLESEHRLWIERRGREEALHRDEPRPVHLSSVCALSAEHLCERAHAEAVVEGVGADRMGTQGEPRPLPQRSRPEEPRVTPWMFRCRRGDAWRNAPCGARAMRGPLGAQSRFLK